MAEPIRSYAVPIDDMTIDDRRARRQTAYQNALDLAVKSIVRSNANDLTVRALLPNEDCGLTTFEDWLLAPAAAALAPATMVAAAIPYVSVSPVPPTHAFVIYGFGLLTFPQKLSRIDFRNGNSLYLVVQVESLEAQVRRWAYLSEDIVWVPNDQLLINVYARTGGFAANSQRIPLDGFTAEPQTAILSARSAA